MNYRDFLENFADDLQEEFEKRNKYIDIMIYSQMFNLLCEKADSQAKGRLIVHVRCLIDEMANIGQIPNLEKI